MTKKHIVILLCLSSPAIFLFSSCKRESTNPHDYTMHYDSENKTNSIYDPSNYSFCIDGNYHKEYGILCRTRQQYDILPVAHMHPKTLKAGYNFEFFNYSGDIQIYNTMARNAFIPNLFRKMILVVIDYKNVLNYSPSLSEEYGEWGKATIITDARYRGMIEDVIVTPLAAKFLSKRSISDNGALIFVRFVVDNEKKYKDYLFYGDLTTQYIIEKNYNLIYNAY